LKNREVSQIFGNEAIVNSVEMTVIENTQKNGLTFLEYHDNNQRVIVKCEKSKELYKTGRKIKFFINADDIALSRRFMPDLTIQNQLEGTVTDLIERGTTLLCIINVGFKLVVEITAESQKRLKISEGSKVWCLFKSVAIDVLG